MPEQSHSANWPDREAIRLIVTRRNATEILLAAKGHEWELPQLLISPGERLAQQLTSGTSKQWGLETYCLFFPGQEASPESNPKIRYAVVEAHAQNAKPPAGLYWMPSLSAIRKPTLFEEDCAAVERALEKILCYTTEPSRGPFGRPGWIRDLFEWIDRHILPLSLRVTGNFQQFNASPSFSLMQIETTGPALWFKATGEPNREELTITRALAQIFPRYVPKFVAIRSDWNGWLAWEAPGLELENLGDARAWESAATSLAELQIASIGRSEELFECGCRDFRTGQLKLRIRPLLATMRDYMEAQEKRSPPPLAPSELDRLGNSLTEACSELEQLDVPSTIGHLDFNPGNILVSPERCVFLDWAEACIASPFITFAYVKEHFRRRPEAAADAEEKIIAAYFAPWQALFPKRDLTRGMILSQLVAVFAYAIRCQAACAASGRESPAHASYLRSLARRMYREAAALEVRIEPCLP